MSIIYFPFTLFFVLFLIIFLCFSVRPSIILLLLLFLSKHKLCASAESNRSNNNNNNNGGVRAQLPSAQQPPPCRFDGRNVNGICRFVGRRETRENQKTRKEKEKKSKEKLTSYLSPRNNILRLPVSHIRGGGTLNEVDGGRNDEEDELGEV